MFGHLFSKTSNRKSSRQQKRNLRVEGLEARKLMAADLTASLDATGVLWIEGTEAADVISLRQTGGNLSVNGIQISVNGQSQAGVNSADVHSIQVVGLGGDDQIDLTNSSEANERIRIPTLIYGGTGNDMIFGTAAADRIYGGDGDDVIYGNGGNDQVWGDAGIDFLAGNDGNDDLWGGKGDDAIVGGSGDDRI